MFKVNNKNTKATAMTSYWCFFVSFEHTHFATVYFEQVNVGWAVATIFNETN